MSIPLQATRSKKDGPALYHCHLLEHEDHDMMRQFVVIRNDMEQACPKARA
ncbi:MAG: multicopper oxidase domain-containing protein [Geminicoccaceae bacterium]|nr:multicopper oxidase domain-containing protein [Geminicoccaceae bacterium]